MVEPKYTTIRIEKKVHDKLAKLGHWGESMSTVIDRLVDYYADKEGISLKNG